MSADAERGARLRRAWKLEAQEALEAQLARYKNTKNPLFAFKALDQWFMLNRARAADREKPVPMPDSVSAYLMVVARRMRDLAGGFDYRIAPEPFGVLPRTMDTLDQVRSRRGSEAPLPPDRARDLALDAFELTRAGWNAFERAYSLNKYEGDELAVEALQIVGGKKEGEAFELLLADYQGAAEKVGSDPEVTDVRGLRKRIRKARRARSGHKPIG
jgi:hypothetical protein